MRTSQNLVLSILPLLAVACASPARPLTTFGGLVDSTQPGPTRPAAASAAPAQQNLMDAQHPSTHVQVGLGLGSASYEFNNGSGSFGSTTDVGDAMMLRLGAEHFFENQVGIYVSGEIGNGDDVLEGVQTDAELESTAIGFGVGYRATLDDDFRMPARFGFLLEDIEKSATGASTTESTLSALLLSVEPELILMQQDAGGGRMQEFSVFLGLQAGAGRSEVDSSALATTEDAYAFVFGSELGLRYKTASGMGIGFSWMLRKFHQGTTDTYESGVVYDIDQDYTMFMINLSYRF